MKNIVWFSVGVGVIVAFVIFALFSRINQFL